VRITATASIVTDPVILKEIWDSNTLLRAYLRTPENPELIIYRFDPNAVRYMREWALEYHTVNFQQA
jgi:general stress protein 26